MKRALAPLALVVVAALTGCDAQDPHDTAHGHDSGHGHDSAAAAPFEVTVRVTLDGAPVADVLVVQAGASTRWRTDADGQATITFDPSVPGDAYIVAAHPDARVDGVEVTGPSAAGAEPLAIALVRFDARDNPAYVFTDPGQGDLDTTTTAACGHCHRTIHAAWSASPHRTAASNPVTHDVYGGLAMSLGAGDCATAGFTWNSARRPGGGAPLETCTTGDGVDATGGTGGCADCHAPGIDGALGGRDLLDATGVAYTSGVHCDVCHKVASVDLTAAPGVAGALRILRPSEPGSPGLGDWAPLAFGPYPDVLNPRMGAVWREELFHGAELCGGCHEQRQSVLVEGSAADTSRWPDGRLPVHTTYDEWLQSPVAPTQTCRDCHMPPRPDVGNAADLYNHFDLDPGVAAGWERAPGEVRGHHWYGPRQPDAGMLRLAATVDVDARREGDRIVASVTTENVGPGHGLPTGEPMRSALLLVEARCDAGTLPVIGGDAVADVGGAFEARAAGEDWTRWPTAAPGQVLRVVGRTGAWRDDPGWGPFGDGTFVGAAKGLPEEVVVGEATILAVATDGLVTLDRALPEGDLVYRGAGEGLPGDGDPAAPRAGDAGRVFARVLVGADGARMVPHHLAVDVASDNRLLRGQPVTTSHIFDARGCADVTVSAALYHRAYPPDLARQRGWALTESFMAGESVVVGAR